MSAGSDELSPVELLAEEFLERQQRGENPTIGEYCEKHPERAEEIREVFEALAMMEELKPDSHDATGTFGSGIQSEGKRLERVGDYRILREIGRGGMGVVYEAEQESLRRRVALKVLPRRVAGDEKALQRFQREARAAARMHHTNIVPVFDVGEDDDHVFYAMQMIQGQGLDLVVDDLKRLRTEHVVMRKDGPADRAVAQRELEERHSIAASLVTGQFHQENLVSEARAEAGGEDSRGSLAVDAMARPGAYAQTILDGSGSTASAVLPGQSQLSTAETNRSAYFRSVAEIGLQTARALAYAHARGIIHRDIKPSNLLLDAAGIVWVTDFGLAKTSDEAMTHTGDILGTIRYMSPERFKGQCDVRADIYSLGLTLHELLVLRPAFASPDRLRLIELVTNTEPPTPRSLDPRIPRDLETIILKTIDKDPRRRYQSADELCEDLERFIQDEPIRARRVSLTERLVRWSRRNRGLAASLATVGALLLAINIAGPLVTLQMKQLNDDLKASELALQGERNAAFQRAEEMAELARQRDVAAQNEATAAERARRQEQLTRRNLYATEINMAQLAGLTGDFARRDELLAHWRTTDESNDLRGHEWYQLLAEGEDGNLVVRTHASNVAVVSCSPDGARFASGGEDGEVHVCDLRTGELLRKLTGHGGTVFAVGWSPDGARLASGGYDMTLRIWDVATGQEVLSMGDHNDWIFRLAWAPPSERVATASLDGAARVWDVQTGEQLALFRGNGQPVTNVAWHPDGELLATVGIDPVVHVWHVSTGEEVEAFEGHVNAILGVDWHPDGERLATAAPEGEFFVWRSGQPDPVQRIFGSSRGRADARWSPDGRWLAVSDASNSIRIHDADTAQEITTFRGHPDLQTSLDWSPDSQHLASSGFDGTVRVWPVGDSRDAQQVLTTDSDAILAADWSPDGRWLATGDDSGRVRVWEADTKEMVRELVDPKGTLVRVMAVEFSPDGALLAAGGRLQNEVLVWNAATGNLVQRLEGPPLQRIDNASGIRSLAWDPERDRLAAGNSHGEILLWQPRTGELLGTCRTDSGANGVCFVPGMDGRWLISAHYAGGVRVWNLDEEQTVQTINVGSRLFALDVNSDGTLLAAGDGFYATGNRTQFTGSGAARVWSIRRTADGIELQDELLLPGPKNVVLSVEFSPDGTRLVAAGAEGTAYVWDVTGDLTADVRRQLLVLNNGASEIHVVRFSSDGIRLAAAGLGSDVRIWDAQPGYARELSPVLLPGLERKMMAGTATRDEYLLRARILARQGDWTTAGATCEKLFELHGAPAWFASDLWVLDGPYPAELETVFAPERFDGIHDFDVLEPIRGAEDAGFPQSLHWQPRELHKNARIDFGAVLENRQNVTGYALLRVYSPRDQTVGIIAGADDEHRLWVNGKLVQENLVQNVARPNEHATPVRFRRGWNSILAKVVNATGSHGLFLALSNDPTELAPIYTRSGESEAAQDMWNRAVASRPGDAFLTLERADFLWTLGRHSEAQNDLDRAVELPGINEKQVRLERAYVLMGWGRDTDALADLDLALGLSPGSPMLLIERGRTNLKLRRLEAAAADYQAAVAVNPTNHWRTFQLAALLLEAGDEVGYERLRSDMLTRWGDSNNATIAERTCKVCLLRPADDAMLDQLDVLLDATRNAPPEHPYFAFFIACDGMLRYRQAECLANGDEAGAEEMFRIALRLLDSARSRNLSDFVATHCDLFRAMTRYRLGLAEPALTVFEQAGETIAGDDFTQPGERYGDGWHDEFMPRITHREAARLIQGPAWEELLDADRLLETDNVELALEHLERAVSLAPEPNQMLQSALELLVQHRVGYEALVPTSENSNTVEWEYRFTAPPDDWNTPGNSDGSGWSSGAAPFGSYVGNVYPKTPWPQAHATIWMRVGFDVSQPPTGTLTIRTYIDEDAEIFVNGVPAARGDWVGANYQQLDVSAEGVQAILAGTNVLAVQCQNDTTGTGIDVGLYVGNDQAIRQRLLNAAITASPEELELRQQRAISNIRLERWREAALDFEKVLELNEDANSTVWMRAAALHAMAASAGSGSIDDYRRVCNGMIEQFRTSSQAFDVERTLKCCSLLAAGPEVAPLPVELVTSPLADGTLAENLVPWFHVASALRDYRRREFAAAAQSAANASGMADQLPQGYIDVVRALAGAVRSLALGAMDRTDEAQAALGVAREHLSRLVGRHADGSLVGTSLFNENGNFQHDRLIAEILVREAEAMIDG